MSAPTKPRGGKPSELTRFKIMWRDAFTGAQRDSWRARFYSATTQAELRKLVKQELGINLTYDDQLKELRRYDLELQEIEIEEQRQAEDEQALREQHPDWTKEQLREELIACAYRRAKSRGDFKLGFAAMKADAQQQSIQIDARKMALLEAEAAKVVQAKEVLAKKLSPEAERAQLKEILK